eukprot:1158105-Pelagomonas_calceolata.AAC.2
MEAMTGSFALAHSQLHTVGVPGNATALGWHHRLNQIFVGVGLAFPGIQAPPPFITSCALCFRAQARSKRSAGAWSRQKQPKRVFQMWAQLLA